MTQKILERYQNFSKALEKLIQVQDKLFDSEVSDVDIFRDSLIQRFEFTLELAKNLQRDILREKGVQETLLASPKDIFSESYKLGLLEDYEIWFKMVKSRNLSSHTYNEDLAQEMATGILSSYIPELKRFYQNIKSKYDF